jgi:hypothetical protein
MRLSPVLLLWGCRGVVGGVLLAPSTNPQALVEPDWVGKLSGFTLLFEALVLMLVQQMPFARSRTVAETWHRVHAICCARYVELALERVNLSAVDAVAFDEASSWRLPEIGLRPKLPKLAAFLDEAETDALAYTRLPWPASGQAAFHQSAGMCERRDQAQERSVSIFPNEERWSAQSYSNRTTSGQSSGDDT